MVRLWSLIFILTGATPDAGVSPPLQLHARVDPQTVKLGEPFTLELVIAHAPEQRYELKNPSNLEDFEYLGQERSRVDGADQSTTTLKVKLAGFLLGEQQTPALELEVAEPAGAEVLPAPRAKVTVVSSLPADAQTKGANLYDVRAPEEVAVRSWRLLYVLTGLLLAGLLAWGIVRWLRRPKAIAEAVLAPPEPLHVRVRKALDALAAEDLPGRGEWKPFYFRLSEIIRGYLGELYGFDALESTTPELLAALRSRMTPGLPVQEVSSFAESSDFVRYAKTEPTVDECKAHLELAYRIVHSTQAAQQQAAPRAPTP